MSINTFKIAFIGGGNMASAMIGGLINNGQNASNIMVCDLSADTLANLQQRFNVSLTTSVLAAVNSADVILLAVKPQVINAVVSDIAEKREIANKLFVSIAAGVATTELAEKLQRAAIVRLICQHW